MVKTIFTNNGYTVYDLGKQVPLQKIIEKIDEVKADVLGLSALLVSTSKQMQYFIEYARQNNVSIPVLCGGLAINSSFINRIAKENGIYNSGVFYCKTAFDGLKITNKLISTERAQFISDGTKDLEKWQEKKSLDAVDIGKLPRSKIKPVPPPIPPYIGEQIRLEPSDIDLDQVWDFINKKSLFVLSWGLEVKAPRALAMINY